MKNKPIPPKRRNDVFSNLEKENIEREKGNNKKIERVVTISFISKKRGKKRDLRNDWTSGKEQIFAFFLVDVVLTFTIHTHTCILHIIYIQLII